MADPALGAKQICPNCQAKFYDLAKRPAHCPKCGTDFDPEEAVKFRRIRARSSAPEFEAEEEAEDKVKAGETEEAEEEEVVAPEIDEVVEDETLVADDEEEEGAAAAPDAAPVAEIDIEDDVELEEDDDAVPFIEEDEDDGFEEDIEGLPEEGDEER